MSGNMFQNRGGALLFGGAVLIAAVGLVGTENEDGAISNAAEQIEERREAAAQSKVKPAKPAPKAQPAKPPEPLKPPEPTAETAASDEVSEFTSGEELVVDPRGIDPTPALPSPIGAEPASAEPVVEAAEE